MLWAKEKVGDVVIVQSKKVGIRESRTEWMGHMFKSGEKCVFFYPWSLPTIAHNHDQKRPLTLMKNEWMNEWTFLSYNTIFLLSSSK